MSNHLGNVLVTISDKKLAVASTTDPNLIAYYNADVVTANDYYPFGSQMPGRKYSQPNSSYRYGFNGKENDNSTGEGNLDFGARIMDVRLGRWLSVDPLQKKHEGESPYMYCGNSPIIYADPDGKDRIITTYGIFNGKTVLIGTVTVKGDHTWGYSNVNSNSHSMMHIVQTVTIDYDKQTPTSSTLTTVGGSYGKQYDDLSYLAERVSEGIHSVVESARSTGTSYQEAGEVLVGGKGTTIEFGNKAGTITGVINLGPLLDAIKSFKPISPEFLKDNKVLEEASKAIGYSSKLASLLVNNVMQSAKYFAYTKDALTGATKIDDTQKAAKDVLPAGSDSCTSCHKVEPKDSMTKSNNPKLNYHPSVTKTKGVNKTQK